MEPGHIVKCKKTGSAIITQVDGFVETLNHILHSQSDINFKEALKLIDKEILAAKTEEGMSRAFTVVPIKLVAETDERMSPAKCY